MAEERKGGLAGILGFLFGVVLGAIGGLLFAPKPGKETREELRKRADELLEQSKEAYSVQRERLQKVASEKGEQLKTKIGEAKEKLSEQVGAATEVAKEKVSGKRKKTDK